MLTHRYTELVLRHRLLVLMICAVLTGLAIWAIGHGVIASSMLKLFFGDNPRYDRYRELAAQFGSTDAVVIAIEDPQLFSQEGWQRLVAAVDDLEHTEHVVRVDSLATAVHVRGTEEGLDVRSYADIAEASGDYGALRKLLEADENVRGLLLSNDGCCTLVLVEVHSEREIPVEHLPAVLDSLRQPFLSRGLADGQLHMVGIIPESVEATRQAHFSLNTILPITVLVLVVIVYLVFLQLWPVIITTGVSAVSILWAFAIAVLMDREINLMLATVPAVMMVVAFSDVVHLSSAYMLELRAGLSKRDAIVKSASEVGLACVFTSITTLVGFVSMVFVPAPIFQQLGVVLGLGVAFALILAMTLTPIFFSFMPPPRTASLERERWPLRLVERLNGACLGFASRRPRLTIALFAIIAAVSIGGIARMKVETSLIDRLDPDNPLQEAHRFVAQRFAGTNLLDVYLWVDEGDLLEPALFDKVVRFHETIAASDGVDDAYSLVDLLRLLHRQLGETTDGSLPASRELLAQYLLLFEMSGGEGIERLIDEDRRALRIAARLSGTGMVATAQLGNRLGEMAGEILGPEVGIQPAGLNYLFGDWIHFILEGQRRGLMFALLATTLVMIIAIRLFGAGLWSMVPNVLPLLVLGGYVGWAWKTTDSDTTIVAMIGIGIAVDDTIHFMTRLRLEADRHSDIDEALRRTLAFSGRGIVLTSVILCCGFLPFASSDYFSTQIMGTLLPLVFATALAADLLLLPALVKSGLLRLPERQEENPREVATEVS